MSLVCAPIFFWGAAHPSPHYPRPGRIPVPFEVAVVIAVPLLLIFILPEQYYRLRYPRIR